MVGMNVQQRYDEISELSGLSEDVVRRVLKASRQSLVKSIKRGERATLPGICTILPELRTRVNIGGESVTNYIKLKATPSEALDTELRKNDRFETEDDLTEEQRLQENNIRVLNLVNPELNSFGSEQPGVRTQQISALL